MNRQHWFGLCGGIAMSLVGATAHADMPPPDDYVETCSVAQQQKAGELCVSCQVTYADFEACKKLYEPQGYLNRCKTWGASVYSEVYCKVDPNAGTAGAGGATAPILNGGAGGSLPTSTATATAAAGAGGQDPASEPKMDGGGCSISLATRQTPTVLALLGFVVVGLRRRRQAR
jgi:MYXO-CTERM domain-containing protein